MSNKSYGLGKEREVKKILENQGFSVIRSRGSFGFYDICAMHPFRGWKLIQVKATKQKYVSFKPDIHKIRKHQVPENTDKEFWIWWSPRKDRPKRGWEIISII